MCPGCCRLDLSCNRLTICNPLDTFLCGQHSSGLFVSSTTTTFLMQNPLDEGDRTFEEHHLVPDCLVDPLAASVFFLFF